MRETGKTKAGCAVMVGILLLHIAVWSAVIYVAWHFISKYW